jgi:hypothetical protein
MNDTRKRKIEVPIVYVTHPRQPIVQLIEKEKKLRRVLMIPLSRTSKQKEEGKMSMLV